MTTSLARHVTVTETDSGMVLLDEKTGRYWQLNDTAATVIRVLGEGGDPQRAVDLLRNQHPRGADQVAADVSAFVEALRTAKLVTS